MSWLNRCVEFPPVDPSVDPRVDFDSAWRTGMSLCAQMENVECEYSGAVYRHARCFMGRTLICTDRSILDANPTSQISYSVLETIMDKGSCYQNFRVLESLTSKFTQCTAEQGIGQILGSGVPPPCTPRTSLIPSRCCGNFTGPSPPPFPPSPPPAAPPLNVAVVLSVSMPFAIIALFLIIFGIQEIVTPQASHRGCSQSSRAREGQICARLG